MAHFKIENLSFSYPKREHKVLDNINLEIHKGEYIVLCGSNGSGKTTLLRHLKSVLAPHGTTEGEIYFEGALLKDVSLRDQSSKIGYVMQDPDAQIVTDKVWHELAFGLESLGCDVRTMRMRVAEMASYFGIQSWFHKNVAELSGGQKQLLNLASVMAMQPEVLILDEPTSQLDPIAATDLLNTVRKINLELGTTVIITEHRLEEVFHAADRVVLMEKGRIIACDSPRNIGESLGSTDSDLFCTLPSTMQIRYRVGGNLPYPLTVREGRQWLSDTFKNIEIKYDSIDTAMPSEETEKPVLELKEVWFRYEKDMPDVLKGVSLKLKEAKIHAIVGGNGTGKSTALKAICGICKPYRGKVKVFGKDIGKYKSSELFENCLAMLPQDPKSLFVKKTVQEDLEEMFTGKKLTKEEIEQKVSDVAKLCRVEHFLDSHPYDLSGGEQQRAALAKVLLCNPKILLLDEPTKAIDNSFKAKFAEILKDLTAGGVTVLMVSHDVEFCAKTADEVSMFFDGGITTTNTPNRFFSQNSFYTTAANRMSRHIFKNAVNNEDVIELCKKNLTQTN